MTEHCRVQLAGAVGLGHFCIAADCGYKSVRSGNMWPGRQLRCAAYC